MFHIIEDRVIWALNIHEQIEYFILDKLLISVICQG